MGWDGNGTFFSARMAARKTGVSYTTISQMCRGDRPSLASLKRFAEAFRADYVKLMTAAGYIPEIEREEIYDDLETAGWQQLSRDDQQKILDEIARMTGKAQAAIE